MPKRQLTTLKNGLRLLTVPVAHLESVTVMVGVGAGSRFETKATNGLFHFLEHMAFKGTKKRPSAFKIASAVDGLGGAFNAFTDKEMTGYYLKLATKHQELAFDILSDILFHSLFKPKQIEKERGVIIEEINLYKDTPSRQVVEVFERLLYGDNPMGWGIAGEKKSVSQIKQADFLDCFAKLYHPGNMVLGVAGKFDSRQIRKLAVKYFGFQKKKKLITPKPIKISQKKLRTKLIFKKTEQTHFCLGTPGYNYAHPRRFALGVLATILGGNMSSRLFREIREKRGLAYYVACTPDFNTDCGSLVIRAGVKVQKTQQAVGLAWEELQKTGARKVKENELKKAKEFLKGRLILALEDSHLVASRYVSQLLLEKKVRTLKQTLKLIDRVTADEVLKTAKDVFKPEKLNLALIGPFKNESRFTRLLK